jgi:hypothetical protein
MKIIIKEKLGIGAMPSLLSTRPRRKLKYGESVLPSDGFIRAYGFQVAQYGHHDLPMTAFVLPLSR